MDKSLLVDIHIEAPVEKVFAFLADPENWNKVNSATGTRMEDVVVTPEGVGTTYRASIKIAGGVRYEMEGRYTEVVPNERIVEEPSGRVAETFLTGANVYTVEPEGSGARLRVEHTPATIGRIPLLGSFVESGLKRGHEPVFADLKALLEGKAAA